MLNIFKGLNEVLSPASPAFDDGMATVAKNMRVSNDGLWEQLALSSLTPMSITVTGDNGVNYTTTTIESAGIAARSAPTVAQTSDAGARMEAGIYYYIATNYDETKGCEGIASGATEFYVYRGFDENDQRINDVVRISTGADNCRIYRTKVIYAYKGGEIQRVQRNSISDFYFVGETDATGYCYDYLHDDELGEQYRGAGSKLASAPNLIASFDGRIFAFYNTSGLYARYSNTGKPLEFPQKHTLTYSLYYSVSNADWDEPSFKDGMGAGTLSTAVAVTFSPVLDNGAEGETYLYMPELDGLSIVGALEFKGKLWVWTASTVGYIVPAGAGYKYVHLSQNFGLITSTLAKGDTFLFGCDSDGAWVLDGSFPKRLSYNIVSTTPTKGEWKNDNKEYWFGDDTDNYVYNAKLDTITSHLASGDSQLLFWFKLDGDFIKENIKVTLLTNNIACDVIIYSGEFPDTSVCQASNTFEFSTERVKRASSNHSGRYIGVRIDATAGAGFDLSALTIEYMKAKTVGYQR